VLGGVADHRHHEHADERIREAELLRRRLDRTDQDLARPRDAGRRGQQITPSMSMVACERAAAVLKRCSGRWRTPPASIAAPSTSSTLPMIEPATDARITS
jgi:hypothetical protein